MRTRTWNLLAAAAAGVLATSLLAAAMPASGAASAVRAGVPPTDRSTTATTRAVVLAVPKTVTFGSTVSGFAQVNDVVGGVGTPVAGVDVQVQVYRSGGFVTVAGDVSDAYGQVPVTFTSKSNSIWRAVIKAGGRTVYSKTAASLSAAVVSWSGRPDDDVRHGVKTSYSFRVTPSTASIGQLQIASAARPGKWMPVKAHAVPAKGVLTQSVIFPSAGTWLIRGTSQATATNANGRTSTIEITVR